MSSETTTVQQLNICLKKNLEVQVSLVSGTLVSGSFVLLSQDSVGMLIWLLNFRKYNFQVQSVLV